MIYIMAAPLHLLFVVCSLCLSDPPVSPSPVCACLLIPLPQLILLFCLPACLSVRLLACFLTCLIAFSCHFRSQPPILQLGSLRPARHRPRGGAAPSLQERSSNLETFHPLPPELLTGLWDSPASHYSSSTVAFTVSLINITLNWFSWVMSCVGSTSVVYQNNLCCVHRLLEQV